MWPIAKWTGEVNWENDDDPDIYVPAQGKEQVSSPYSGRIIYSGVDRSFEPPGGSVWIELDTPIAEGGKSYKYVRVAGLDPKTLKYNVQAAANGQRVAEGKPLGAVAPNADSALVRATESMEDNSGFIPASRLQQLYRNGAEIQQGVDASVAWSPVHDVMPDLKGDPDAPVMTLAAYDPIYDKPYHPPNPYFAFVDLKMKTGFDLTPIPSKYLTSFKHTLVSKNSGGQWEFTAFDEGGTFLQKEIMKGNREFTFRYGYVNGEESLEYCGKMLDYKVNFELPSASLNLSGADNAVLACIARRGCVVSYGGKKHRKISDIVKAICYEEGWELGIIEETEIVTEDKTGDPKTYIKSGESSLRFIKYKLLPDARSQKDKRSDYIFYLEQKEGKTYCHFRTKPVLEDPKRVYAYYLDKTKNDVVLSFSVGDSAWSIASGRIGGTPSFAYMDKNTNDIKVGFVNDGTKNTVFMGDKTLKWEQYASKLFVGAQLDDQADLKVSAIWDELICQQGYSATMQIVGDPTLCPPFMIAVEIIMKNGEPHFTSGTYIVQKVIHEVTGGTMTTTFEMNKWGASVGERQIRGVDAASPAQNTGAQAHQGQVASELKGKLTNPAQMGGNNTQYDDVIKQKSAALGWDDPIFIKAVIGTESSFNPKARSGVGAQGLMQLMPKTARGLGITSPYDPVQNIHGGTKYIKNMRDFIRDHGGPKSDSLYYDICVAYNWGPGNWLRWKQGKRDKHGNLYIPPKESVGHATRTHNNYTQFGGQNWQ